MVAENPYLGEKWPLENLTRGQDGRRGLEVLVDEGKRWKRTAKSWKTISVNEFHPEAYNLRRLG